MNLEGTELLMSLCKRKRGAIYLFDDMLKKLNVSESHSLFLEFVKYRKDHLYNHEVKLKCQILFCGMKTVYTTNVRMAGI